MGGTFLRINVLTLALQLMTSIDAVANLQPGDVDKLPTVHITDKDKHLDIVITVSRDAPKAEGTTHLPDSKG